MSLNSIGSCYKNLNFLNWKKNLKMKKVIFCLFFLVSCSSNSDSLTGLKNPLGNNNVAYYWGKIALEATANDTERFQPRPTITSRYLGLIFTSVFDAWTSYDKNAIPVYSKDIGKIDEKLNTLKNKEISISYAAYTALKEYYYSDSLLFKEKMEYLGLNPYLKNPVKNSPEYIGIKAALNVINARKNDGSNQYGELSPDGSKYFDYTYYSPVNPPGVMNDINKWQPKYYYNEDKNDFEDKLKKKVIEIDEWEMAKGYLLSLDGSDGMYYSSDVRIYYSELTIKENKNLEIILFIKDYEGYGIEGDSTLNIQGLYNGRDFIKHTIEKNVKFLNPINGKWENFLLEFEGEGEDSINYNYTHHIKDNNLDFAKDFPQRDKLNKALQIHLDNIKKYGKK